MELHEVYQNVVKARPELGARENGSTFMLSCTDAPTRTWCWMRPSGVNVWVPSQSAEALIESHWLRALPDQHAVQRVQDRWVVANHNVVDGAEWWGETPLHALAEFHVPGSTREAKP